MNYRVCLCGSKNFKCFFKGEHSTITRDVVSVHFEALKCLNCQLVVTNPPPDTKKNLDSTNYKIAPSFSKAEEQYRLNYSNYRLQRLKPYLNADTRNLEIGCSDGNLVEMVKQIKVKESIGLEITRPIAEFCSRIV